MVKLHFSNKYPVLSLGSNILFAKKDMYITSGTDPLHQIHKKILDAAFDYAIFVLKWEVDVYYYFWSSSSATDL